MRADAGEGCGSHRESLAEATHATTTAAITTEHARTGRAADGHPGHRGQQHLAALDDRLQLAGGPFGSPRTTIR